MKNHETTHGTQQKPPTPTGLAAILVVGFLMLLLFWFGTKALYRFAPENPNPDPDAARAAERAEILKKINEEAAAELGKFGWKDEAAGTVQIPVARAMEIVVARLQTQNEIVPTTPVDPVRAAEEAEKKAAKKTAPPPSPEPAPAEDAAPENAQPPAPAVEASENEALGELVPPPAKSGSQPQPTPQP